MFTIGQQFTLNLIEKNSYSAQGYSDHVAHFIQVKVNKVTQKAVNFTINGTKYNLWFPQKSIIVDDELSTIASVASWFTFEGFHKWVLENLSETFVASNEANIAIDNCLIK